MIKINTGKNEYEINEGESIYDMLSKFMPQARFNFAAAKIDGNLVELTTPLTTDTKIELIPSNTDEGLNVLRHSAAHIMAAAVRRLFPGTKITIGPSIENGFYYDFDSEHRFNEDDFPLIEAEMQKIIDEDQKFVKTYVKKEEAVKKFSSENETYKVELINDIKDAEVSYYQNGDFIDLCRGPHVPTSKVVKAVKLLKLAGAYWRGDEKNKMLQRIYGTAFADSKSLKEYLKMVEEAKEREHRKIGKEMNLFSFYNEGPGFPFWKPNGMKLYNAILEYWRKEHYADGYVEVKTPIMLNEDLWHQSGHWDNYKENMYFTKIDGENYAVKPMNCPGGILIYNDGIHSYRELPLKIAELGLVHRHEKSGVLHGLFRVRQFTQDDAHIYCTQDQVKDEVKKVIALIKRIYDKFGFKDVHLELSTKPEKSVGSAEVWELAEKSLKESLEELELEYKLNPGDGAFYGPKIDFHIKDAIGRSWQCGTIQCDFNLPERFDMTYIGADGQKHRPVMLHRTAFGSIERFIGIITENYKGKFPFWMAPEQIRVITIAQTHEEYAKEVRNLLQKSDFRVNIDSSQEKLGGKITQSRLERVTYLIVIGDAEMNEKTLSIRKADSNESVKVKLEDAVEYFDKLRNI